jgi:hypothetical protein
MLTITITDQQIIDGWTEAAIRNGTTPEELAAEFLNQQGAQYAGLFEIAVITTSAFMRRLTVQEYIAILTASQTSLEITALIDQLTAAYTIMLLDPRLLAGLQLLAEMGLISPERIPELLAYQRPVIAAPLELPA